jgi:hypothetical protein
MPRTVEIAHYSELLASLVISAARATDPVKLAGIRVELVAALVDVFTLISHDAGALGFAIDGERKQTHSSEEAIV